MTLFNAAEYLLDRHVAAGDGQRVAVRCNDTDHTYAELLDLSARVAGALLAHGVRREERVMLCMSDGVEMLATLLGCFRAGIIAVPISTMLTGKETGILLADSRARVLVCTSEYATIVGPAVQASPDVVEVFVVGDGKPDLPARVCQVDWAEAVDHASLAPIADTTEDSPAFWLYTSGTTGTSKAAMHRQVNVRHVYETYGTQTLGIRRDDRCLSVAKLFFAYGLGNSALFPLAAGAMAILEPRRPSPEVIAERIAADAPTLFFGVPTFFAAMLAADLPADLVAGVRCAASAGEALPASLQQRWTSRFGVPILDGLGSTEALHIFLSNSPDDIAPGTSGRAVPGYELEIRDDHGDVVQVGAPGSLFMRGESSATGYWSTTRTTRQVFQGEWLATGDTYVQTPTGHYQCLGRSGDMIKAGGIWVSPAEVESRLLEHEQVIEAAVVGVPDVEHLIKPIGCVVVTAGSHLTGEDLVAFCREGLAHFKAPRSIKIVESLPRTATGKLQRFRVRELVSRPAPQPTLDRI